MISAQAPITSSRRTIIEATSEQATSDSRICPACGGTGVSRFLSAPDRFHGRRELYHLRSCPFCSCIWLVSPPTPEEMPFHYGRDYHNAIAIGGEGSPVKRWESERETVLKYKQCGSILDIGCSSGAFLSTMPVGSWKLYGIEMDPSMADRARQTTDAEVFTGDAINAPFAPESFDIVTSFDVLEHVYDSKVFLAKVWQWLKPGGIYCVRVPNIDCWEARMLGSFWYGLELPRHLFHFSPRSLSLVMRALGFEEVQVQTSPVSYLEYSAGYFYSAMLERLGFSARPLSQSRPPGFTRRAVRKAVRLTVVEPFGWLASRFGAGASILGIFRKPGE